MKPAWYVLLFVTLLLGASPGLLIAQQAETTQFIYVAAWDIPRAQWNAYVAGFEKDSKPILERMAGNGTLLSWGAISTIVHEVGGMTHGIWWSGSSVAAIERVREELLKAPPSPALTAATSHRDLLMTSLVHKGKATPVGSGYLYVAQYTAKPGMAGDWLELWERHDKPALEDQLAKGNILYYGLNAETVHTQDPGWREVVTIAPNAEAQSRFEEAMSAHYSSAGRSAANAAFREVLIPASHRDYFARITSWWHK